MWRLKGCQRCGGDMFIGQDEYGWYQECLQCGHRAALRNLGKPKNKPAVEQREPVLAGSK